MNYKQFAGYLLLLTVLAAAVFKTTEVATVFQGQQAKLTSSPKTNNNRELNLKPSSTCSMLGRVDQNYGTPNDIFIEKRLRKTFGYIADGWGGLTIIDVSDPRNPKMISHLAKIGNVQTVFVKDKKAFIGCYDSPFCIVDVTFPSYPRKIGEFQELTNVYQISATNNYLILSDIDEGLVVLDVSKPATPVKIHQLRESYGIFDLEIQGTIALAAGIKFDIFNVTDIRNITIISERSYGATDLCLKNDLAFLVNWHGFRVINVSNIFQPELLVHFYDQNYRFLRGCILGEILYLVADGRGLLLYNVSDINSITKLTEFYLPDDYNNACFSGEQIFLISQYSGVKIIEIGSSPTDLHWLGYFKDGGTTEDIFIEGGLAYVANGDNGLQIIDISNPYRPRLIANPTTFERSYDSIYVKNNVAFLASHTGELTAFNVSDPNNPVKIIPDSESIGWRSTYDQLEFDGDYAFILHSHYSIFLSYSTTLTIVNTTVLTNITVISSDHLGDFYAQAMVIRNHTLFIGTDEGELLVYNISNPAAIQKISRQKLGEEEAIIDMAIENNYAFLGILNYGLKIYDISNVSNIEKVGSYLTATAEEYNGHYSGGRWIQYENNHVYMADADEGMLVFDVSDVRNPELVGQFSEISEPTADGQPYKISLQDIAVKNKVIYLAAGKEGLIIVSFNALPPKAVIQRLIIRLSVGVGNIIVICCIAVIIVSLQKRKNEK